MSKFEDIKKFIEEFQEKHKRPYVVAVDFDGTLCEEAYPGIGEDRPLMIMLVKTLQQLGVYTILWTCRSGQHLDNAKQWCNDRGLYFMKYNEHASVFLKQFDCKSPKVYADMYLDDRAHNATHSVKDLIDLGEWFNKSC